MISELDLSICGEEKIHIPGMIQPGGMVIVYERWSRTITAISENVPDASAFLRRPVTDLVPADLIDEGQVDLQHSELGSKTLRKSKVPLLSDGEADIVFQTVDEEILVEIVAAGKAGRCEDSHHPLGPIFERLQGQRELARLCENAAAEIRKLTGYDRVMVYRFDEVYNGTVIAEDRAEGMTPYLGLSFPASDIPPQARELYRRNTVRIIADVNYAPIPLLRASGLAPLDMTHSHLRSVSPVHLEYLRNMGVRATMTISLLIDGRLWGLIACHHRTVFPLVVMRATQMGLFGCLFSGMIGSMLKSGRERQHVGMLSSLESLLSSIRAGGDEHNIVSLLGTYAEAFTGLVPADGFAIRCACGSTIARRNQDIRDIPRVLRAVQPHLQDGVFITAHLAGHGFDLPDPILEAYAGLLAIEVETEPTTYWIWYRREKPKTLTWGGNPDEKAIAHPDGSVSPRKSFEAYKQKVRYQSEPWSAAERQFPHHFRPALKNFFERYEAQRTTFQQQVRITRLEHERLLHYKQLLEILVDLIEQRDAYTAGHTRRVADYCDRIAQKVGLTAAERDQLRQAAMLHDIGKIIVPDAVLLKPGRLDRNEFELIKTHLEAGYHILAGISYYRPLAEIIRHHHEKYDGSGYPKGAKGDEIPFSAHIMIVADAVDAMTSNRIYQARKSMADALEELREYRGTWYHPDVVDAAVDALAGMEGDTLASQVPLTAMEKARFSYYYKDRLTGAFNESYLQAVLEGLMPQKSFHAYVLAELTGMSRYNEREGWHAGNRAIRKIAFQLLSLVPSEQLFRVFGDDFAVGCSTFEEAAFYMDRLGGRISGFEGIGIEFRTIGKNALHAMFGGAAP